LHRGRAKHEQETEGQIVATPGALAALKKAGQQAGEFLTRHVNRE